MNQQLVDNLVNMLTQQLEDTGRDLKQSAKSVAQYTISRAQHLAQQVNDPAFQLAVDAERRNVALYAGIAAVEEADKVDARITGIIQGALAIGATALLAL